jgi:predicted metalloprotease with PDZ domain
MRPIVTSVIASLLLTIGAGAQTGHYVVTYDGGGTMHVRASLPAGDGRLLVATGGGIDHLPNEWATFVRNIRATETTGADVAIRSIGKEGWRSMSSGPLTLDYEVDLSYARGKWPAGNEQAGRLFFDADGTTARTLFTITKPLFVYTTGLREAVVRFALPRSWNAATPWTVEGDSFRVSNATRLTRNSVVLGVFPSQRLRVGTFEATVATPGLPDATSTLATVLRQMGVVALKLFPGTPPGAYLMTFFREDTEDGESFEDSAALTSPDPLDETGMVITGNTVVHELLHHWFGGMLQPASRDSLAWFSEGFTEYYANRILARSGSVPAALMRRKLANVLTGYTYFFESPLYNGVSLASAGLRKGSYRFGVYNGGWAVALSLDVQLRTESNGRRSLDDVLVLLFQRHGVSGRPLTERDVQRAVSDVAGRDMAPFFARYVDAHEALPLRETLGALGLSLRGQPYAADLYLTDVDRPSRAQLRLRTELFGTLR